MQNEKKSKAQLIEELKAAQTLLNASHHLAFLLDDDGIIITLNEAAVKKLGKDINDLVGTNVLDLSSAEIAAQRKKAMAQVVDSGQEFYFEEQLGKNTFEHMLQPVFDTKGKVAQIAIFVRDTTELKESEKNLSLSKKILSQMHDGVILTDQERKIADWTGGSEKMFGYTREEILGKPLSFLHRSENEENLSMVIKEGVENNGEWLGEIPFVRKDGSEGVCETLVVPVLDEEGHPAVTVGVNRDVTERKQLAESLKESQARLQLIADSAPVMIGYVGKDLRYQFVNRKYEELFDVPIKKIIGHQAKDFIAEELNNKALPYIEKVLSGQPTEFEISMPQKGRMLHKKINYVPHQVNGEVQGFISLIQDITEFKKLEEELRQSEKSLRIITENAPGYILQLDRNGVITYINRPAPGYTVEEMIGTKNEQWLAPEFHSSFLKALSLSFQTGKIQNYEVKTRVSQRWYLTQINPIIEKNHVLGAILVAADISQLKEMESQLRVTKEQAETANRAKSQFLANMGHEIRTPLNAISGFSQILLTHKDHQALSTEFKEYLGNIQIASDSLTELINNVLNLSKMEAGKVELLEEDLNLKKLFQGIFHINKSAAHEKKLNFTYQFDSKLPEYIHSDRTKLNQILMKLVANAIKFTPAGKKVALQAAQEGGKLLLQVINEGIGIPKERQQDIFNTFEQVDGSSTRKHGGAGVGLAITKKMVEMMGGEIMVESETDQGATFSVKIPLKEASFMVTAAPVGTQEYHFSKDNLILVVEDDRMNQQMLEAMFKNLELEAIFAGSGEEAIGQALELKKKRILPNLILMNMQMPGMDGITTTQKLLQHSEFSDVPIVALSAEVSIKQQHVAHQQGFADYLTKPIDFNKFLSLLEKYLFQSRHDTDVGAAVRRYDPFQDQQKPPNSPLPDMIRKQVLSEWDKFLEFPIYYADEIIEQVEKIQSLCMDFDSEYPQILKEIVEVVYQGDEEKYTALIAQVKQRFPEQETLEETHLSRNSIPADLSQLPQLLNHLENEVRHSWEKISEIMTISAIEDFARQVQGLGTDYHYQELENWGNLLLSQATVFDMEAVMETLKEFPELLHSLKSLL